MRLTWHIVRKDLVRLRWVLLLWVVVLTGYMALATIQAALDEVGYYPFYITARIFGALFLPLLGFGLVMGVQHDDPVSDTDAFWITRPISGPRLLGAKGLVLALLCLVPALSLAPWWLAHGFNAGQVGTATLQLTRWQALIVLAAVPFAITSRNAGRFVMSVLLAAGGAYALVLFFSFIGTGQGSEPAPSVSESRAWVILAIWTVATLTIALIQFLTRRTRIALAVLTLAVVACCAVDRWWTWTPVAAATTTAGPAGIPHQASPSEIVAQLRPQTDAVVQRRGLRIRVAEVMTNDPRGLTLTINESAPDFAADPWRDLLGRPKPVSAQEFYFLMNQADGRTALAKALPAGETLSAGAITFRRKVLIFGPRDAWKWDNATFNRWAQAATLVEVVAHEAGSSPSEPDVLHLAAASSPTTTAEK